MPRLRLPRTSIASLRGRDPGRWKQTPYDHCAPEGAQGVTRHRHIPLVCRAGRWHFVGMAR